MATELADGLLLSRQFAAPMRQEGASTVDRGALLHDVIDDERSGCAFATLSEP
jgi:hypothetical protein